MFDEIESLINSSKLPDGTRIILIVITSAIRWLIWPFVGIGILLSNAFFPYWLGFFIFIESVLFLSLVYILIGIAKYELNLKVRKKDKDLRPMNANIFKNIREGIIGNLGFYLFIAIAFIILKLLGTFNNLIPEFLK